MYVDLYRFQSEVGVRAMWINVQWKDLTVTPGTQHRDEVPVCGLQNPTHTMLSSSPYRPDLALLHGGIYQYGLEAMCSICDLTKHAFVSVEKEPHKNENHLQKNLAILLPITIFRT